MNPTVKTSSSLNPECLSELARGEVIAIRVPNFYPSHLCIDIAQKMGASELYGRYANAPLIGRVGQAFFESLASEEHRASYQEKAVNWIGEMRSYCEPYLSPIDKLRLVLDEAWPGGSRLGVLNGKKMFVGLARVFGAGAGAEAHQDVLSWDAPGTPEAESLVGQFAANIYLKMPKSGGDLLIWPISLTREEYHNIKISGSYGVHASMIGCEPVRIQPSTGELVLFNSKMLHAVEGPKQGDRITWSCFVGTHGTEKPLMMWS